MSKVIDEVVFKKSIEDMLQYLSDNCLYEFVPYDDTEISDLFSLTPEEAQKLSDLISDEVVSKYKLWSSSKVNESLISAKSECNDYTDKMLTNISSISIKYVDTLPTSDISTSTIYILKNTGGGNDTLNLYDGSAWTVIGDFVISLDDYYKKSEMDTKLNDKANKTEVLSADKVLVSAGSETHDNVYSAQLTKTELDKKANDDEVVKKTDISTVINSTSTNDTIPTNKTVYDYIINNTTKFGNETYNGDLNNIPFVKPNSTQCYLVYQATSTNLPSTNNGVVFNTYYGDNTWGTQMFVEMATGNVYTRCKNNGTWTNWKRMCTTSVEDVPRTELDMPTLTEGKFENAFSGNISNYSVKNGVCTLTLTVKCVTPISNLDTTIGSKILPKSANGIVYAFGFDRNMVTSTNPIMVQVDGYGNLLFGGGTAGGNYRLTFSYTVAES